MNRYNSSTNTESTQKQTEKTTTNSAKSKNRYKIVTKLPKIVTSNGIQINRAVIEPYRSPFVIKSNQLYLNHINYVRSKPPKPTINTFFIETEKRLIDYRRRNRKIEEKEISEQNQRYKEGIISQKSLFGKFYGKEFQEKHDKLIQLFTRSKPYVLPPVQLNKSISKKTVPEKKDDDENFDMRQQQQELKQSKEG